jgi:predicted site-specific integrase-resolvase
VSGKEYLYGRKRRPSKGRDGTRTALYLRVSTADQKPDLQYDGLRAYAAHASLEVVQDYCDVGVSGRREGRLEHALKAADGRRVCQLPIWLDRPVDAPRFN